MSTRRKVDLKADLNFDEEGFSKSIALEKSKIYIDTIPNYNNIDTNEQDDLGVPAPNNRRMSMFQQSMDILFGGVPELSTNMNNSILSMFTSTKPRKSPVTLSVPQQTAKASLMKSEYEFGDDSLDESMERWDSEEDEVVNALPIGITVIQNDSDNDIHIEEDQPKIVEAKSSEMLKVSFFTLPESAQIPKNYEEDSDAKELVDYPEFKAKEKKVKRRAKKTKKTKRKRRLISDKSPDRRSRSPRSSKSKSKRRSKSKDTEAVVQEGALFKSPKPPQKKLRNMRSNSHSLSSKLRPRSSRIGGIRSKGTTGTRSRSLTKRTKLKAKKGKKRRMKKKKNIKKEKVEDEQDADPNFVAGDNQFSPLDRRHYIDENKSNGPSSKRSSSLGRRRQGGSVSISKSRSNSKVQKNGTLASKKNKSKSKKKGVASSASRSKSSRKVKRSTSDSKGVRRRKRSSSRSSKRKKTQANTTSPMPVVIEPSIHKSELDDKVPEKIDASLLSAPLPPKKEEKNKSDDTEWGGEFTQPISGAFKESTKNSTLLGVPSPDMLPSLLLPSIRSGTQRMTRGGLFSTPDALLGQELENEVVRRLGVDRKGKERQEDDLRLDSYASIVRRIIAIFVEDKDEGSRREKSSSKADLNKGIEKVGRANFWKERKVNMTIGELL